VGSRKCLSENALASISGGAEEKDFHNRTSSLITNWIANGNKWTVPVGGGVSKVVRFGEQPIKFGLAAYYPSSRSNAS
jgi:hypothetical protein